MKKQFVFILILFSISLRGEIIILKNGQKYEGKIINQTKERVQLQLKDGRVLILDKKEIQKIQYSAEEIQKQDEEQRRLEELKKREEEQRKLEELKKQEERRRKLEEIKKKEEQLRLEELKKQEEKKIRESIFQRKEILAFFGIGVSEIRLPIEKIENLSLRIRSLTSSLVFGYTNNTLVSNISDGSSAGAQLKVEYRYNNWIFGLESINLNIQLKTNINYLGQYSLNFGTPLFSTFFSNSLFSSEIGKYDVLDLYTKYFFYKFKPFSIMSSYLAVPFGFSNFNFDISYVYSEKDLQLIYNSFVFNRITLNDTTTVFTGIALENHFKNRIKWEAQIVYHYGEIQYTNNKFIVEQFLFSIPIPSLLKQIDSFYKGIQSGFVFTNQIEMDMNENWIFFVNLTILEMQSMITKITTEGFGTNFQSNLRDISILNIFLNIFFTNNLQSSDKKFIEKNQFISFGFKYRWIL